MTNNFLRMFPLANANGEDRKNSLEILSKADYTLSCGRRNDEIFCEISTPQYVFSMPIS